MSRSGSSPPTRDRLRWFAAFHHRLCARRGGFFVSPVFQDGSEGGPVTIQSFDIKRVISN